MLNCIVEVAHSMENFYSNDSLKTEILPSSTRNVFSERGGQSAKRLSTCSTGFLSFHKEDKSQMKEWIHECSNGNISCFLCFSDLIKIPVIFFLSLCSSELDLYSICDVTSAAQWLELMTLICWIKVSFCILTCALSLVNAPV